MSRKPLTDRRRAHLSGATGMRPDAIQQYRESLWAAGYDVPGMEGFVAKAKRLVKRVSGAVGRFARSATKHVKAGMPKPPPEVIAERRAICKACPHWTGLRCQLCECLTRAKTSWAGESCPDGRWGAWSLGANLGLPIPAPVGNDHVHLNGDGLVPEGGVLPLQRGAAEFVTQNKNAHADPQVNGDGKDPIDYPHDVSHDTAP